MNRIFVYCIITIGLLLGIFSSTYAENTKVQPCTWKDCHKGAVSISLDDALISCLKALRRHDFKATYFISYSGLKETEEQRKKRYSLLYKLYKEGNEIGVHSYSHPCVDISKEEMQNDLIKSILYARDEIRVASNDVLTMSWPCGFAQHEELASEYFLAIRGYEINRLEDATPEDFMNLKSFNSPEHNPDPKSPILLKAVYLAEKRGKWANLVFHGTCNLYNIIDYVAERGLWVAPVSEVVKYILQRDSVSIKEYKETPQEISFKISRPAARATRVRRFEDTFKDSDQITFKIDIDDSKEIETTVIDGQKEDKYKIATFDSNNYILINSFVPSKGEREIRIIYKSL